VTNETAGSQASVEIPETKSLVPRCRKSELTVRRDDHIRDETVVTVKDAFWIAIFTIFASQLPDKDGLVSRTSQDHVWVLRRSCNRGDPAAVTAQNTFKHQTFRHVAFVKAILACDR